MRFSESAAALAEKFADDVVAPASLRGGYGWLGRLRQRNGRFVGDEYNVLQALRAAPELSGLVVFNEFAQRVELSRSPPWRHAAVGAPWADEDDLSLQAWLQAHNVDVRQRHVVADCVISIAREQPRHPVRSYLDALQWDGRPRLSHWLIDYLHADGDEQYLVVVGRRFLIQAVARIFKPGCQADYVLVLEGPQGCGKSRTVMAISIFPDWFTDSMPDLHDKDAALQLSGRWICELAELAAMRRTAHVEAVKAFITRPVDMYRPPYARRVVAVPRQCVFIATTNETEYLRDQTGNRRFWPVRCGRIDVEAVVSDRDQIWAEAVVAYRAGEQWHLTAEESMLAQIEQSERQVVTELERQVMEYADRMIEQGYMELSMRAVLIDGCGLDSDAPDFLERCGRLGPQVAHALNKHGWKRAKVVGRGRDRRVLYRYAQGLTG